MGDEYLATGFAGVDGRAEPGVYRDCLALLDSLPDYRHCKARSYKLLGLEAGHSVLEAGCGIGDDAFRMARLVQPGGQVLALDASRRLLEQARTRCPPDLPVWLAQADARRLPLPESSFDRCRIDRTLQHIADPQLAIRELVRVLKPGGLLLAYDNDWGSFCVNGRDPSLSRLVAETFAGAIASPWIGRYLGLLLADAGLVRLRIEPRVSLLSDFATADRVYDLRRTVARLVQAGRIESAAGEAWIADLQAQTDSGTLLCALTAYTAVGLKPGP
jgi:ubiquinone/menaquinone biosynthesis C-methylase UbiE